MKKAAMCIVQNLNHAERVIKHLQAAGISSKDIAVLSNTDGAFVAPKPERFLETGPLLAVLYGAATETKIAKLTGALIGMGLPAFEAKRYEVKIKGGNLLIFVHTDSDDKQAQVAEIFHVEYAVDICSTTESRFPRSTPSRSTAHAEQESGLSSTG